MASSPTSPRLSVWLAIVALLIPQILIVSQDHCFLNAEPKPSPNRLKAINAQFPETPDTQNEGFREQFKTEMVCSHFK